MLSVCSIFVFLFSMCTNCNSHYKIGQEKNISKEDIPKEITLQIVSSDTIVLPVGKIDLLVVNETDSVYTTGQYYKIERFEDGEWTEIPIKFGAFEDIGYVVKPKGGRYLFTINLQNVRHTYRNGKYRICKKVHDTEGKKHLIYCTFYVENK